jgi:hypothetical protein
MFPKLKVFPVKELVNYGLGLDNPPSVKRGAVHLSAKDYHEKLKEVTYLMNKMETYCSTMNIIYIQYLLDCFHYIHCFWFGSAQYCGDRRAQHLRGRHRSLYTCGWGRGVH